MVTRYLVLFALSCIITSLLIVQCPPKYLPIHLPIFLAVYANPYANSVPTQPAKMHMTLAEEHAKNVLQKNLVGYLTASSEEAGTANKPCK